MNIFQKLCEKLTDHKFRKLISESVGIQPVEYHYRCRICRQRFWNYGVDIRAMGAEREQNMKEANILIQQYTDWLKNNITPRQINENTIALDSPFLDRHNDYIQIYIVQGLDKMRLSDDGATLEDLRMDGFEINNKWRKSQIEGVLRGFGIAMDIQTGELYTEASAHNFAAKKHALIQTILAVNDMYVLKPCPFCGGAAEVVKDKRWARGLDHSIDAWHIECKNVDCVIYQSDNNYYRRRNKAIEAWNRRA